MKTIKLSVPDSLAQRLDQMVESGLFQSTETAVLFAVTAFVLNPMPALSEHFGIGDLATAFDRRRSSKAAGKAKKPAAKNAPLSIYQLRITLDGIKPPIWRRFQVRSDSKLTTLHNIIMDVMGWSGYHLHEFQIDGLSYTNPEQMEDEVLDGDIQDGSKVKLSQVMEKAGDKITYIYDFGDGWKHTIMLEKILDPVPGEKYPVCLDGARSCPPEDCGGPGGYADLLKTLANPNDPEHETMKEWVGPYFDPEEFDIPMVNSIMRRRVAVKKI